MKQLLAIYILVLIFVCHAYAPDVQKLKVCVLVADADKEDKTERDIIESHLKRELRTLGNVVIVDKEDDWEWIIMIGVIGHKYKDGTKAPHISIASSLQMRITENALNADFHNIFDKWPLIPVFVEFPKASYWSRNNLPSYCIQVVNDYDKIFKKIQDK